MSTDNPVIIQTDSHIENSTDNLIIILTDKFLMIPDHIKTYSTTKIILNKSNLFN